MTGSLEHRRLQRAATYSDRMDHMRHSAEMVEKMEVATDSFGFIVMFRMRVTNLSLFQVIQQNNSPQNGTTKSTDGLKVLANFSIDLPIKRQTNNFYSNPN